MLDSPPCTSSATCYALTTPVALHEGSLIIKTSDGYWEKENTYLGKRYTYYFSTKTLASDIEGKTSTGLFYSACFDTNTNRNNSIVYCANKGMRLANRSETTLQTTNGVPMCNFSFWLGSTYPYGGCSSSYQTSTAQCEWNTAIRDVRCVK